MTQVIDPAGNAYTYTYTANVFAGTRPRLASTTQPGSPATTINYHYEDSRFPGALTGKSFNGVRYSTFAYDDQRRAILTEHAGGIERFTFSYKVLSSEQVTPAPAPPKPGNQVGSTDTGWCEYDARLGYVCYEPHLPAAGRSASFQNQALNNSTKTRAVKVSVTTLNPLGRKTTYLYQDGQLISVAGDQSPRCAASYKELTYDANGLPDILSDFQGTLSDFDYDAKGRLVKKVEAAGTPLARTVATQWNTDNRITRETILGTRQSDYTYDSRGNVASAVQKNLSQLGVPNQTRALRYTYTYHANGLKASMKIDGPLANDDITYAYSAQGDLLSLKNGLGHATSYANYNALGLPGKVTGPNGDVIETTYDARGRVISQRRSVGSGWSTTSIAYDAAGNVASISSPEGVTTRLEYDAGKRLLRGVTPLADGTYKWTQYSYDNASNLVRQEVRNRDLPLDSVVTGAVQGLSHDGNWNWSISGWACTTGSRNSIQVRAIADPGQILATQTADIANDASVGQTCQAGGTYRFRISITLQQRQQLGGRPVSVYGLSPLGSTSDARLPGSGSIVVPAAPVIGDVAGVTQDGGWNYALEGWSCAVGVNSASTVRVYAGGGPGQGSYVGAATGTLVPNEDLKQACQSQGAYWFKLPLNAEARIAHANKSLHVIGVSPSGTGDVALTRSGQFSMPAYTRSVKMHFYPQKSPISNGESTALTAEMTNNGNVVWQTDNYLAWGEGQLNQRVSLPYPVAPGQSIVLNMGVAPLNHANFTRTVSYFAQLSSGGTGWGPNLHTVLQVAPYYEEPVCQWPNDCQPEVSSISRRRELQEGER